MKRRKIVVHILTIFISLIIILTSSIIIHSYIISRGAVLKLANELTVRDHASLIETLKHSLSPVPFIKISAYLINDGVLSISDIESLTPFMYLMLKLYPEFNSVYLADEQGNMFLENQYSENLEKQGLIRFIKSYPTPQNTKFISEIVTRQKNKSFLTLIYKDANGKIIKKMQDILVDFDPRTRPWYKGAVNNLDHHWIGVYAYYGEKNPGMSISFSIRNNNQNKGVVAADLSLETIAKQIKYLDSYKNKYVFIINDSEEVLGANKNVNLENKYPLPKISDIKEPIVTYGYKEYQKLGKENFIFFFNGVEYVAYITPFAFNKKSSWKLISIIPIDFFVATLKRANQYNLAFSLITLVVGLILVFLSSQKISKPIIYLANEAENVITLLSSRKIRLVTHIKEIKTLLDAVNKLKLALSSFAKYVPKVLVLQLLESKKIAQVGGENKNVTLLFTDIANFTQISEKVSPVFLMHHLSSYLDALTKTIQKYSGNVDKYIGDAIMAFWGAPIEIENHSAKACEATLACKFQVHHLNQTWLSENKPPLYTRFGLAAGQVVIGNVGSTDRLNYTAIGDVVNLTARLEALNKIYGTEIITNSSIYEECKEMFLFRPLDKVNVRGKQEPLVIYELVATKQKPSSFLATPEQLELCALSEAGYQAFYEQKYSLALEIFNDIYQKFENDGMAKLYIERCMSGLE